MRTRVIELDASAPAVPYASQVQEPPVDPKTLAAHESRLVVLVVRTDQGQPPGHFTTLVRHRYTEEMMAAGVDYDPQIHFMRHESAPLLDALVQAAGTRPAGKPMVYGRLRAHGTGREGKKAAAAWFQHVVGAPLLGRPAHGIYDRDLQTRFRAIVYSADENLEALLVPIDSNIRSLADLGIALSGDPKAPKRLKRATAPHRAMLQFTVTNTRTTPNGTLFTLRHDALDREFTVLDFDIGSLPPALIRFIDGAHLTNLFSRLLSSDWNHVKFTGVLPDGLAKGFGHAAPQVEPDVVLFGSKPELRLNGTSAYLGVLDFLHVDDAHLDIQTGVNMGFFAPGLATAEGEHWLREIERTRFGVDEDLVRDLDAAFARVEDRKAAQKPFFEPEDQDPSVRAAKLMVESQTMPVLWRRSIQRSLESTVDITRGRILMSRVMRRLNLCPNLLAFHPSGRPDPSLDQLTHTTFPNVPKDLHIVCCHDMDEGPMFVARNPNTHSQEAVVVWNAHLPSLRRYRGRGLLFFGIDACELLVRLNGADFDDSVLATTDQRYIAAWKTADYPVTDKLTARAGRSESAPAEWTPTVGDRDVLRWASSSANIGRFINDVMLDTLLSGQNRSHAIEAIKHGRYWAPTNFSCGDPDRFAAETVVPFLERRPDYVNAFEATNSEFAIDWLSMAKGCGKTAVRLLNGVTRVHTFVDAAGTRRRIPCFPKTWDSPGKCRIPPERKAKGDYLLVETPVCQALNGLAQLRETILEKARRREWQIARPIPREVDLAFPANASIRGTVHELRRSWRRLIDRAKARNHGRRSRSWYAAAANGEDVREEIHPTDPDFDHQRAATLKAGRPAEPQYRWVRHDGLRQEYFYTATATGNLTPVPLNIRIGLAVEWLRRVYEVNTNEPTLNQDGTTRSFGDGVPDFVLHDFLTALECCHLTGLVVHVQLDARARRRLTANRVPVRVRIVMGRLATWVIDADNGLKLGTIAGHIQVPGGSFLMSPEGVIVIRESGPVLHSRFMVEQLTKRASGQMDEVANSDAEGGAWAI